MRLAQQNLSEITGEFTSDDLLGRIFSSFCIGSNRVTKPHSDCQMRLRFIVTTPVIPQPFFKH
ncbi:hypothetical protein ACP0HM_23055 [Escherichia coli]